VVGFAILGRALSVQLRRVECQAAELARNTEALHEIDARFRDIIELSGDWIWETGPDNYCTHRKLEALKTLAGGVAHELNNTLVPIVALSRLILDDMPQDSPMCGDMKAIIQASERARDLVKQILAFSRKDDLARQPLDLAEVTRGPSGCCGRAYRRPSRSSNRSTTFHRCSAMLTGCIRSPSTS
jgi:signal transduction histidine kinase